jgi:hypothetical protein
MTVCYLLPLIIHAVTASWLVPLNAAWTLFGLGLSLAFCGAIPLYLLLREWEEARGTSLRSSPPQTPTNEIDPGPWLDEIEALQAELVRREEKEGALREERTTSLRQAEQLKADLQALEELKEDELRRLQILLSDHTQTISQQRSVIEGKQDYILKLENKVRDQAYEIKTLLRLDPQEGGDAAVQTHTAHPVLQVFEDAEQEVPELEPHEDPTLLSAADSAVQTPYDAAIQLQRCLDIASKMSGAGHLTSRGRRDALLPTDSFAIDMRRLWESYKGESSCTIFVYSPSEEKLLFCNEQVKALLGWGPDTFVKKFDALVDEGWAEWKHALADLKVDTPTQCRLLLKTESRGNLLVQCHLGLIPTGAFAGNIVGIVYGD